MEKDPHDERVVVRVAAPDDGVPVRPRATSNPTQDRTPGASIRPIAPRAVVYSGVWTFTSAPTSLHRSFIRAETLASIVAACTFSWRIELLVGSREAVGPAALL